MSELTISSPANGATVRYGNVQITGTASDNLGRSSIKNAQVKVNSRSFKIATLSNAGNISTPVTIKINVT
jgi:hypothetical protein